MVDEITPRGALERLVDAAGSQAKLARALGISSTAVWKWMRTAERLPAEHVLIAERLFGVSRHDLRPDIYPRDYPPAEECVVSGRLPHRLNEAAQ